MQGGRNCLLEHDEKKLHSEQDFISRETDGKTYTHARAWLLNMYDSKNTYQEAPDISQFPSRNLDTKPAPISKTALARFTEIPPFSITY